MFTSYDFEFPHKNIETTLTDEASVIENWINQVRFIHHRRRRELIVGLDVEWRPNFRKGVVNRVALLQLCVGYKCLIVQLFYLDFIPQALVSFLNDSDITFVGVGIKGDLEKLTNDYGLHCSKHFDLAALAANKLSRNDLKNSGLKGLAMEILKMEIDKPKRISRSNWSHRWLTIDQIRYASMDACLSFEIGLELMVKTP